MHLGLKVNVLVTCVGSAPGWSVTQSSRYLSKQYWPEVLHLAITITAANKVKIYSAYQYGITNRFAVLRQFCTCGLSASWKNRPYLEVLVRVLELRAQPRERALQRAV